jgi:hypothetical protein
MDNTTRHARIAQRFLVSMLQRHGPHAPEMLRRWADELERLERDMQIVSIGRACNSCSTAYAGPES